MLPSLATSTSAPAAPRRLQWWWFIIIAVMALAVYANSLRNGFAYDDTGIIQQNDSVTYLEWTQIWSENYWPQQNGYSPDILYRPLTIWSYLANYALTPDSTWAFHMVNVILHAIVTLMVTALAWRVFANRGIALLTGVFFALHPIHTEVVANTVGRAELLAALWSLAAILIFLPQEPLPIDRDLTPRRFWHGWLVAACFFLAILCKETPVALAPAFVLIDVWRCSLVARDQRPGVVRWFTRQTVRYYIPIAVAFGVYMVMRIHAVGLMRNINKVHPVVNPLVIATLTERIVTPFALLAKYLSVTFWPVHLSADYSAPSFMPISNPFQSEALIGILLVALSVIVVGRYWKKAHPSVLCILFFALSYALAANVLRIGTIMGERLFYMPSMFVLMLVSWGIVVAWNSEELRRLKAVRTLMMLIVIAACGAMSVRTVIRNTDWEDDTTLAISTARDNPNSAKACFWAGMTLVQHASDQRMLSFGEGLLKHAIELYRLYPESYWELAKYYGRQNDVVQSTFYLAETARFKPGADNVRTALKEVLHDLRRVDEKQLVDGLNALRNDHNETQDIEFSLGLACRAHGKLEQAEQHFSEALRIDPHFSEAVSALATTRIEEGHTLDGVATLRLYVRDLNRNFDARCDMARALMKLDPATYPHAFDEAQMNIDRAASIQPGARQVREMQFELNRRKKAFQEEHKAAGEPSNSSIATGAEGGR